MKLWPQRVRFPLVSVLFRFLCLVKQSGGCLEVNLYDPYKLHPMKLNWWPFDIKECLVFKPSSVQYKADGLTNVERNTTLVYMYQRMKVRILPSEQGRLNS